MNNELYDWLFWHNPHEELIYAIHRDSILLFFSGKRDNAKYYKSSEYKTLVEIVCNPTKIEGL